MPELQYEPIVSRTRGEIEEVVRRDDPNELLNVVLAVALYDDDPDFAESFCVKYSSHPDFNVRGNAVLGFGHIARIHEELDESIVKPIIVTALSDGDEFVRGQAASARDDTEWFLKWKY